jgi:flagellar biosynthesis protein FliP
MTTLVLLAPLVDPIGQVATPSASPGGFGAVGMIVVLTLVTLLPAVVLSCTCFVRFIVVLGFVRNGLGTPSAPPNQVLVGLALFMSIFVSAPVASEMYQKGGKAYLAGQMDASTALDAATPPLRTFLLRRTSNADLELFYEIGKGPRPTSIDEVPLKIAIPAFLLSELRLAFKIGLTILLPFLVIDLVAATILTSLGMVMVPPQVVALPVKLLVFVMIDGWHLVVQSLLRGAMS